ncbi:unnamed protein product [Oppiella nova]|uniref:Myb-like domain-containing protein n=1 Tax=Oppiella nova TaxID=334625 RepID=A0A7R9QJF9_9ACAR|nr:unnamed protein product [Oppiella nova]CAG2167155.1 unnamed protein product [Oppiella nova]
MSSHMNNSNHSDSQDMDSSSGESSDEEITGTDSQSCDKSMSSLDLQFTAEDNRALAEINRNKLSSAPLHLNYPLRRNLRPEQRAEALSDGLVIKKGKFSREEDAILKKNWHQFCDDFPVDTPHLYLGFFTYTRETDQHELRAAREVVKASELNLRLARGLADRTIAQVYQRARKKFSGLNRTANLTPEEKQQVYDYHLKGVKKAQIASSLFCTMRTVGHLIRQHFSNTNRVLKKDYWTQEESDRLVSAIRIDMKRNKTNDYSEIDWKEVSKQMGDRSEWQCQRHFRTKVYYVMSNGDMDRLNRCVCTFQTMCRNWYNLKAKVHDYNLKTYPEIVDSLYKRYVGPNDDMEELEEFCKS